MLLPHKTLLAQIATCEALAEKAYDQMYDSRYPRGEYSDLKDYFAEAIGLAQRAGLTAEVDRLSKRLEHCKAVYRKQFCARLAHHKNLCLSGTPVGTTATRQAPARAPALALHACFPQATCQKKASRRQTMS